MKENESVTKKVIRISAVAALYVALTLSLSWLSYGDIQFRIAEILVLLCFFRKDYAISLIVGCAIANCFSPMGIVDVLFGTIATTLSVLFIAKSKHLILSIIYPALFNGVIVGLELYYMMDFPFVISSVFVFIGEAVVMIIGYFIFRILKNNKSFIELIHANQNI